MLLPSTSAHPYCVPADQPFALSMPAHPRCGGSTNPTTPQLQGLFPLLCTLLWDVLQRTCPHLSAPIRVGHQMAHEGVIHDAPVVD